MLRDLKPLFWERVIGKVISDAYGSLIIWNRIHQELANLEALSENYSEAISPKYMKALLSFRYVLDQASKGPILNLKTGVPASHPLRSLYVREPEIPGSSIIRVRTKSGIGTDNMLWIFQTLWDDKQLFLCGLPYILDELERLIESDSKEKERLSSWVARVLSDLGVIARSRHEIDIYQPWAAGMDHEFVNYEKEIIEEFAMKFTTLADLERSLKNLSLAKVGMPSDGKFQYPSDKRRTQQATEKMRKAEQHLDLFWQAADQQYQKKTGSTFHQALQSFFTNERQVERTPE